MKLDGDDDGIITYDSLMCYVTNIISIAFHDILARVFYGNLRARVQHFIAKVRAWLPLLHVLSPKIKPKWLRDHGDDSVDG